MYIGFKMVVFRGTDPADVKAKILFSIDCEVPEHASLQVVAENTNVPVLNRAAWPRFAINIDDSGFGLPLSRQSP